MWYHIRDLTCTVKYFTNAFRIKGLAVRILGTVTNVASPKKGLPKHTTKRPPFKGGAFCGVCCGLGLENGIMKLGGETNA